MRLREDAGMLDLESKSGYVPEWKFACISNKEP
jgi:hypothetical protein